MGIIDDAIRRAESKPHKRIDYARMNDIRRTQRASLTRAVNSGDPERIARVCKAAVAEWTHLGAWPEDWANWQRALDDALPWPRSVDIADL